MRATSIFVQLAMIAAGVGCSENKPATVSQNAPNKAQTDANDNAARLAAPPQSAAGTASPNKTPPLLAVPADVDTAAPEDILELVRRLSAADEANVFPTDPNIPLSRELADA